MQSTEYRLRLGVPVNAPTLDPSFNPAAISNLRDLASNSFFLA